VAVSVLVALALAWAMVSLMVVQWSGAAFLRGPATGRRTHSASNLQPQRAAAGSSEERPVASGVIEARKQ